MKKEFCAVMFAALALTGSQAVAAPAVGIDNGSFEGYILVSNAAQATKDHGFGNWSAAENRRIPSKWVLNLTSPGKLQMVLDGNAADGKTYLKVTADVDVKHKRGAHLYNFAKGLAEGKKYRISAKVRNGSADIGFYEYKLDKTMKAVTVCQAVDVPADKWVEVSGEYTVPANFKNAYLAVMVPWSKSIEIDDVKIAEIPADGK